MASTYSPNLNLELQATGEGTNVWGQHLNNNVFSILDSILGGTFSLPLTNVDVTLTTTQAGNNFIVLSGTLTGNVNIIFPQIGRTFFVLNSTTGAFTVTLKTSASSGASVVIPTGTSSFFILNGTDVLYAPNVLGPTTAVSGNLPMFSGTSGKILVDSGTLPPVIASEAEAQAGASNTVYNSPLRTGQQIDARLASQAQAQNGTDDRALMTPIRTSQAIQVQASAYPSTTVGTQQTVFPIGTTLLASGQQNRNFIVGVYLSDATPQRYALTGTFALTGSWITRGELGNSSDPYVLVQRVT